MNSTKNIPDTLRLDIDRRISAAANKLPDVTPDSWAAEFNRQADSVREAVAEVETFRSMRSVIELRLAALDAMAERIERWTATPAARAVTLAS